MLNLPKELFPKRGLLYILLVFVLALGCKPQNPDSQEIIDMAIAAHGWQDYKEGVISFRQDTILYRVLREDDAYLYSRTFQDNQGRRVHDVLGGSGFTRTIDNEEVTVGQKEGQTISEAIRRAVFFTLLPQTLQDVRMKQKYIGNVRINGQPYHKLSITFPGRQDKVNAPQEGNYLLWFHRQRHTLDYIVYAPDEEKSTGSRFCQAVNQRNVEGILFQDYNIYATSRRISPARLDYAFKAGKLELLSEVKLHEVNVSGLPSL